MALNKELNKLSDKQLLNEGEELSTLIREIAANKEEYSREVLHENAAKLYTIDKLLAERGYSQYQPTIDYYEKSLKLEKDKVHTDAYAYLAIGLVIFASTTIYAIGYAPNRITWLSQALSLTLMIRGVIKFYTPRNIYYSKE